MWLGAAAGLALLTWSLIRPISASNVSLSDQQLTYVGQGWQLAAAPQACIVISQTIHTTSHTGDFVTFNFTGNAVFVRGPFTTNTSPAIVILDGQVQPDASPTIADDGCGVLYTNTNITGGLQEHTLTLLFSAGTGAVQLSISGITVTTLTGVTSQSLAPNPSTQFQVIPQSTTTVSGGVTSQSSFATVINPAPTNSIAFTITTSSTPLVGTSTAVGNVASAPSQGPTKSAVSTSAFATPPGMTATLIGGIVGAILAMLGLLFLFILLRRRITKSSARKRDQENSFGREAREMEEARKKAVGAVEGSARGRKKDLPQYVVEIGPTGKQNVTKSMSIPTPLPVAFGSNWRPREWTTTVYSHHTVPHVGTSTPQVLPVGGDDPYSQMQEQSGHLSQHTSTISSQHRITPSSSISPILPLRPPSRAPGLPTTLTSSTLNLSPSYNPSLSTVGGVAQLQRMSEPCIADRTASLSSSIVTQLAGSPHSGYF
ncbi:hypothetical protein K439DRAFT_199391 [Ramaria rubella]|nr:hypothetical protein K439DRAFT_199391 [Ramaria rubella]